MWTVETEYYSPVEEEIISRSLRPDTVGRYTFPRNPSSTVTRSRRRRLPRSYKLLLLLLKTVARTPLTGRIFVLSLVRARRAVDRKATVIYSLIYFLKKICRTVFSTQYHNNNNYYYYSGGAQNLFNRWHTAVA